VALKETLAGLPRDSDEAGRALHRHGVTHVVLHAGAWAEAGPPQQLREWLANAGATRLATVGQTEIWQWPEAR